MSLVPRRGWISVCHQTSGKAYCGKLHALVVFLYTRKTAAVVMNDDISSLLLYSRCYSRTIETRAESRVAVPLKSTDHTQCSLCAWTKSHCYDEVDGRVIMTLMDPMTFDMLRSARCWCRLRSIRSKLYRAPEDKVDGNVVTRLHHGYFAIEFVAHLRKLACSLA